MNLRRLYLAALAALPLAVWAQATPYCAYAFSPPSLPEGTMAYDVDGETLHFSAVQAGFNQGEAWKVMREEGIATENWFAASTSRYKKGADGTVHPANDWLVMPPVYIRADDAVLTWRSRAVCENLNTPNSYAVHLSASGNQLEDFSALTLLADITDDAVGPWVEHRLDLGAYAGRQVWIAFVNTTLNGETLAIDDVTVAGSQGTYAFDIATPPYEVANLAFCPAISFTQLSDQAMGGFTVHLEEARSGKSWTRTLDHLDLHAGESTTILLGETETVSTGDTLQLRAWLDFGTDRTDVLEREVVYVAFRPRQSVVIEEGTGAWCGYCPRGIVALSRLKAKYGEAVLPIAVHYDDIMEVEGYIGAEGIYFPLGFPSGEVNRAHTALPMQQYWDENGEHWTTLEGGFETCLIEELQRCPSAEVSVAAHVEGRTVQLTSEVRFCVPQHQADLRMAYILTQDEWSNPAIDQKNYLSGCGLPFDGFEDLPGSIAGFVFEDVARGAAESAFQGIEGSLPADIEAEQTVSHRAELKLPSVVTDAAGCHVAALLIDHATGRIVNAARASLDETAGMTAIHNANPAPPRYYDLYGRIATPQKGGIFLCNGQKIIF